ncbi:MAG: FKBP-type peptidyl-prolyl cis-trans isomerase [Bryobacteraceae bacterium]
MRFLATAATASLMIVLAGCGSAPAPAPTAETKAAPAAETPAATPAPTETAPATTAPAAATPAPAGPVALTTDEQKTIYAVGLAMSRQLGQLGLSDAELDIVKRALSDAAIGKPAVDIDVYGPKIDGLVQSRQGGLASKEKAAGAAYALKAATAKGAVKTASGLVYRELTVGSGASPKPTDKVKVHYRGTLLNGTEFDSSYKRNAPAEFPLNGVIPCWTEGVQKMKVGGKSALVCPADIAYGDAGRPGIPGGATLLFDVELLSIN